MTPIISPDDSVTKTIDLIVGRENGNSATRPPDKCLMVLGPVFDPRVVTRDGARHYSALMPTVTNLFRRVVCRSVPFGTMGTSLISQEVGERRTGDSALSLRAFREHHGQSLAQVR